MSLLFFLDLFHFYCHELFFNSKLVVAHFDFEVTLFTPCWAERVSDKPILRIFAVSLFFSPTENHYRMIGLRVHVLRCNSILIITQLLHGHHSKLVVLKVVWNFDIGYDRTVDQELTLNGGWATCDEVSLFNGWNRLTVLVILTFSYCLSRRIFWNIWSALFCNHVPLLNNKSV